MRARRLRAGSAAARRMSTSPMKLRSTFGRRSCASASDVMGPQAGGAVAEAFERSRAGRRFGLAGSFFDRMHVAEGVIRRHWPTECRVLRDFCQGEAGFCVRRSRVFFLSKTPQQKKKDRWSCTMFGDVRDIKRLNGGKILTNLPPAGHRQDRSHLPASTGHSKIEPPETPCT